jgi:hypothetical protein
MELQLRPLYFCLKALMLKRSLRFFLFVVPIRPQRFWRCLQVLSYRLFNSTASEVTEQCARYQSPGNAEFFRNISEQDALQLERKFDLLMPYINDGCPAFQNWVRPLLVQQKESHSSNR